MAQTRRGSYILPFVAPAVAGVVDVDPDEVDVTRLVEIDEQLFPRRSLVTLNDALLELHRLTIGKASAPSREELNRAVVGGVSGDLCQAVVNMVAAPGVDEMDMTFRWALVTTAPRPPQSPIAFPRQALGLLDETATRLRDQAQKTSSVVYGHVSSLDRDPEDVERTVKVKAVIDRRLRPISVILSGEEYHRAVLAHDTGRRVVMAGELLRPGGRSMRMSGVKFFDMEEHLPVTSET